MALDEREALAIRPRRPERRVHELVPGRGDDAGRVGADPGEEPILAVRTRAKHGGSSTSEW
jgi:hypothetical protein